MKALYRKLSMTKVKTKSLITTPKTSNTTLATKDKKIQIQIIVKSKLQKTSMFNLKILSLLKKSIMRVLFKMLKRTKIKVML
jgi:hypothetical protein